MSDTHTTLRERSAKGDIWYVGHHRIAYGDSRDAELVSRLVGKSKVKIIACDVPYGIAYAESKEGFADICVKKDIENDDITDERSYETFSTAWLKAILPHLDSKNAIYIFNCDKMIFALREAMRKVNIHFAQLLIWVKNQAVIGRMDYLPQHELIAYGWYGRHKFMRAKDKSVLCFPRPSKSPFHPTQKTTALMRNLILNSSSVGDIVFDGFLGSGTTALACEETGRICYGIELDPHYCDVIIRRLEDRYGLKAVKQKLL